MRDFCKFSPDFWSGLQAEQLKQLGRDAMLLATYLQTNRHSNMLGVYYLPVAYMSHDTGIPLNDIQELLTELGKINFSHYDAQHGFVWVVELGFIQTGGALKELDKRVVQLRKQYQALPRVFYLPSFYEKYQQAYHLMPSPDELHPTINPIEAPLMPLRSKKKNKKKENNKEMNKEIVIVDGGACMLSPHETIFNHWKATMNQPQAIMDKNRKKVITSGLDAGFSVEQLCNAITGCSRTPYNMGNNAEKQRFDGLKIIFRDAEQIERFIRNYQTPPVMGAQNSTLLERNQASLQAWLNDEEKADASQR